jgi:hypothetical protein
MDSEYTSQGLSKRLKDKGFRGEHKRVLEYRNDFDSGETGWHLTWRWDASILHESVPCFSFTEIWGMLPARVEDSDGDVFWLYMDKTRRGKTEAFYCNINDYEFSLDKAVHESPAEAIGLLLEWLIDNGLCDNNGGEG